LASNCENKPLLQRLGWIYTAPPAGLPSIQLFRCQTSSGDHFDSLSSNCDNNPVVEGPLGYVIARRIVSRAMRGSDHQTGAGVFPPGYRHEHSFGFLAVTQEPGTQALYGCQAGTDSFTSLSSDCENPSYQKLGLLGFIWQSRPANVLSVPLYRCQTNTTSEHFDTTSETCEGNRKEHLLGYLVTELKQ
jgi:hypothetical protein